LSFPFPIYAGRFLLVAFCKVWHKRMLLARRWVSAFKVFRNPRQGCLLRRTIAGKDKQQAARARAYRESTSHFRNL